MFLPWQQWENIKQVKGNECSQCKSIVAIFSSSLPICPIHIFSSDTLNLDKLGRLTECLLADICGDGISNMPSTLASASIHGSG